MFGLPRRQITTRRIVANVPLFDPSGDSRCTGWWRADRNVAFDAASAVSGWTSMLPTGLQFAPQSPYSPLFMRDMTRGFPAVCLYAGSAAMRTNSVLQAGDQYFTITVVSRVPGGYGNAPALTLWLNDINAGFGFRNFYGATLNMWAGGTVSSYTSVLPWGDSPAVVTMRKRDISETNSNPRYVLDYNGAQYGAWDVGSPTAGGVASYLEMQAAAYGQQLYHEVIVYRATLSDAEVATMHALLMRQYGLGA